MKTYAVVIEPSGKFYPVEWQPEESLRHFYDVIGCDCIECVYLDDGQIMVVDESGLFKENPRYNILASAVASTAGCFGVELYGTVVLLKDGEEDFRFFGPLEIRPVLDYLQMCANILGFDEVEDDDDEF